MRADETVEVGSVIFFLERPSFIPLPAINLLAACQPTAPTYPPSTDTVRKKSSGICMLTKPTCPEETGALERGSASRIPVTGKF